MDTIFALASGKGRAGVAVVRVSGPAVPLLAELVCGSLPEPRKLELRTLRRGSDVIDRALVAYFPEGSSFTGEAVLEFQLHGSIAVVSALLSFLGDQDGTRMALPGEFTRRALYNGKLDLTQVEGLADLIDAETEAQRRQALRVLSGEIGKKVEGWRAALIRAAALLEATIDFADEDVPVDVMPEVTELIDWLSLELNAELLGSRAAERIRDGFEVAIIGFPNVGKSTLLNRLAGREAALVSEYAGTTRDVIEVRMDVGGLAVTFLDTAGLRETSDPVETRGVNLARSRAGQADLRIFLTEDGKLPEGVTILDGDLICQSKVDIAASGGFGVSGRTGAGVDELLSHVESVLRIRTGSAGLITRLRQKSAISVTLAALESAKDGICSGQPVEVLAEQLRVALDCLADLIGRTDVEDLLGEIFSSFCIGK